MVVGQRLNMTEGSHTGGGGSGVLDDEQVIIISSLTARLASGCSLFESRNEHGCGQKIEHNQRK